MAGNEQEDLQKQVEEWKYSAYAMYDIILDLRKKLREVEEENVLLKKQLEETKGNVNSEQITERFTTIPNVPKRGAKRKADDTTRQYIHELRRYNNSLQAIADETGMSKTQVHTILKEPEQPGRWYSVDADGGRKYYSDYDTAIRSKKKIMYEVMSAEKIKAIKKKVKAVQKEFTLNMGDEDFPIKITEKRYVIADTETGEILDDAQGYGYKTAQGAYKAYGYKKTHKRRG